MAKFDITRCAQPAPYIDPSTPIETTKGQLEVIVVSEDNIAQFVGCMEEVHHLSPAMKLRIKTGYEDPNVSPDTLELIRLMG